MTMFQRVPLEEGWAIVQKGIDKVINILEGRLETQISSEEYMMLNTTIYNMCTQRPPYDFSQQLYVKYRQVFEEYITSTVLPCLRNSHGESMLRELVKRWQNHKFMVLWLSRFFNYLERYFIARRSLPSLNEVGLTCFRDLVVEGMNGKVGITVTALFILESEGKQIDRALLKNVSDIFVEIGMGQMEASNWILEDSFKKLEVATVKDSGGQEKDH